MKNLASTRNLDVQYLMLGRIRERLSWLWTGFFLMVLFLGVTKADHPKIQNTSGGLTGAHGVGLSTIVGTTRSDSGKWTVGHGLAHHRVENLKHTSARVTHRLVFYNNSRFDGFDSSANANDDPAIASDKEALLPGGTAGLQNYTSYSRGLNGLMVDVVNLRGDLTLSDFSFRMGNNSDPDTWTDAPQPGSIHHRYDEGNDATDRVTFIWADGALLSKWLEIRIHPGVDSGFLLEDRFYFGNAVGETGDASFALVNATDLSRIRANPIGIFDTPATITSLFDINRDGFVNAQDYLITRSNPTSVVNGSALELIQVPD